MSTSVAVSSCRTKQKTRILRGITVAIAGSLGPGWSDADVARWMAYNGGKFVASLSSSNANGVTHLLCSRDEYAKPKRQQCGALKVALQKNVRIVTKDWLEDSLHRRRRRPKRPYLLKPILKEEQQSPEVLRQKALALRERGRREGESFIDSSLYRLYRDSLCFVSLPIAGTTPPYWFAARHYKSRTHTRPRSYRPSGTCQLFGTAFGEFTTFFRKKTGVA
ncbi:hypothetical protein Sste5346_005620 [Sporothrix stenoceras]|uniref:BRCT domain-containing protein n=1 Tax=Sporothrix stenoceras TaxID=5173 RepID=A0ABR3Z313_9PEZI